MNRILPPRPFLDAILVRVLVLWLFLHAATSFGAIVMTVTSLPQALIPNAGSTVFLIAVIVLVIRLELRRRSEIIFLANLGHSFRGIALVVVAECLVLEAGLRVAIGLEG
jgi:hypothetical protein